MHPAIADTGSPTFDHMCIRWRGLTEPDTFSARTAPERLRSEHDTGPVVPSQPRGPDIGRPAMLATHGGTL